jgi:hypothetical protein
MEPSMNLRFLCLSAAAALAAGAATSPAVAQAPVQVTVTPPAGQATVGPGGVQVGAQAPKAEIKIDAKAAAFAAIGLLKNFFARSARTGLYVVAFALVDGSLQRLTDPGPNAIQAGQHYVSIVVEELRIHGSNLPRPLALALKVSGALPQGNEFTAILGTARKEESDGFFKFNRPVVIAPFVYKGKPLTVEIALAPCSEDWAQQIDKAKEVWGTVRDVDPNAYTRHPIDATHLGMAGSDWFRADFAAKAENTALPLAAGQYVIIAHENPDEIAAKVTFDDRGLIWKGSGEIVKGVSFATLRINRRKRGPRRETPLAAGLRAVEGALTAMRIEDAKNAVASLPDLIKNDPHITEAERDLFQTRTAIYQLQIDRLAAKNGNDKATFVAKSDEILQAFEALKKKFADMIEPAETNQMEYEIRRVKREKDD